MHLAPALALKPSWLAQGLLISWIFWGLWLNRAAPLGRTLVVPVLRLRVVTIRQ